MKKISLFLFLFIFVLTSLTVPQDIRRLSLQSKADLLPKIIGPVIAFPGSSLGQRIRVGIKNDGRSAAKNFGVDLVLSKDNIIPVKFAAYSATFKEDCLLQGGREFVNLLRGKSTMKLKLNGTNMIPADTPPGMYYLAVVVDTGKTVKESNERNNVAKYRIRILRRPVITKPDLVITRVYFLLDYPDYGDVSGSFCFDIQNVSHPLIKTSTTQNFILRFWLEGLGIGPHSDINVSGANLITLHNLGKVTVKYDSPDVVAGGQYAMVDATNLILEQNESNNTAYRH